jgi:hypothetical protein
MLCILGRYETGWLMRGKRGGEEREASWAPALLVYLLMAAWSRGIRVHPQRLLCLCSPCAPSPALGRRGAAHPDPAAARSAYALVSSSHLVFTQSNLFAIFHFHSSPSQLWCFAYMGICSSPPTGAPRPVARPRMFCASGRVVQERRKLARCAGVWSSLELAHLFLYFVQLYCISFFYSILYSRSLFPPTLPTSSTPSSALPWTR